MKRLSILLISLVALVAVACGSDDPAAEPTSTPTPAGETPTSVPTTPTPTPGGSPVTPTAVPVGPEEQPRLDEARNRWNLHRPESYEFDFEWSCECLYSTTMPVRIRVTGDQIVSIKDPVTGDDVTPPTLDTFKTIDDLLDWIQGEIDTPAEALTVEYERDFGYPINALSDRIINAADDELAFRISRFRVDPEDLDIEALKTDLNAAQSRWYDAGYQNYTFDFWWECFCPAEFSTKVKVEVRAGQVASVTNAQTAEAHTVPGDTPYRTVMDLYGWIYERLNKNPEYAALEFDSETGLPIKAQFDPIVELFDDEESFFIENLEKLDVHSETQAALDAAKAKWEEAGLSSYDYEFNWSCFCVEDFTARVVVSVRDGAVTNVKKVEGGTDISADLFNSFVTVDALFARIQDAIDDDAAQINAEFDSESGIPTSVFIDYSYMIADEEIAWSASRLVEFTD